MTCPADNLGPTCPVPLTATPEQTWECPQCGTTWIAGAFWNPKT